MGDGLQITRISHGRTEAAAMEHGIEIAFDALPGAWEDRDLVEIAFPDGKKVEICAEPDHGPTTFSWARGPEGVWHIRLEPVRPGVLRVALEEHLRDLLLMGH